MPTKGSLKVSQEDSRRFTSTRSSCVGMKHPTDSNPTLGQVNYINTYAEEHEAAYRLSLLFSLFSFNNRFPLFTSLLPTCTFVYEEQRDRAREREKKKKERERQTDKPSHLHTFSSFGLSLDMCSLRGKKFILLCCLVSEGLLSSLLSCGSLFASELFLSLFDRATISLI